MVSNKIELKVSFSTQKWTPNLVKCTCFLVNLLLGPPVSQSELSHPLTVRVLSGDCWGCRGWARSPPSARLPWGVTTPTSTRARATATSKSNGSTRKRFPFYHLSKLVGQIWIFYSSKVFIWQICYFLLKMCKDYVTSIPGLSCSALDVLLSEIISSLWPELWSTNCFSNCF